MVSTPTRPAAARPRTAETFRGAASSTALRRPLPAKLLRGYRRFWSALEGSGKSRNGSTYYLILGTTLALTAIGIMMVLSASSVEAIAAGESPYSAALKQGLFAGIGVFLMFMLSRINVVWLKRLAWAGIIVAYGLLGLVLVIGTSVNGNKNWIEVGGFFTLQPSEAAKLALALWMATVLAKKSKLIHRWQHAVIPVVPVALGIIGLVLAGNDLGTGMII
ncbi:MAG: cell division protein FtsW, partial [Arthrobacter pascens]|nr:cell division protein FtsW [Arthrobacter pascens]